LSFDELGIDFQPQYNVSSGHRCGFEAVPCWYLNSSGKSPLSRQETGSLGEARQVALERWVLDRVCLNLLARRVQDHESLPVAMDISALHFFRADFTPHVVDTLARHGVTPALLRLELSEGAVMSDTEEAARRLRELKAQGVAVVLDGFGTGRTSLSQLRHLPVEGIKVDRSFVRNLPSSSGDAAIMIAFIQIAHSLGIRVIADGVSTLAQLEFLRIHGCDVAQDLRNAPI
jgi:EAL domain-containing protein (putative c-di-GMP-specific phosphodiesterase class I)